MIIHADIMIYDYNIIYIYIYLIAFGKHAGHREVAPREFDVHSRWKPAREAEEKRSRRRIEE